MADEIENEENQQDEEKKKKSSIGLVPIIIITLLVAVLGVGGFIAWQMMNEEPAAAQSEEPVPIEKMEATGPGILIEMENITVNLSDEDENRFLRAKMKIEVDSEETKVKVETYNAQIRDTILTILSSKRFDDIRTARGKYELKEELVYRINLLIGGEHVKHVFFSDFVAQ